MAQNLLPIALLPIVFTAPQFHCRFLSCPRNYLFQSLFCIYHPVGTTLQVSVGYLDTPRFLTLVVPEVIDYWQLVYLPDSVHGCREITRIGSRRSSCRISLYPKAILISHWFRDYRIRPCPRSSHYAFTVPPLAGHLLRPCPICACGGSPHRPSWT
ncbi:hypothetical protein BJX61DRAFT_441173 [Aspergillus egyptiacus]|nr:hypothetical protein BJX61DRAFT_441173 [Aspergillus egyptiacus]